MFAVAILKRKTTVYNYVAETVAVLLVDSGFEVSAHSGQYHYLLHRIYVLLPALRVS